MRCERSLNVASLFTGHAIWGLEVACVVCCRLVCYLFILLTFQYRVNTSLVTANCQTWFSKSCAICLVSFL